MKDRRLRRPARALGWATLGVALWAGAHGWGFAAASLTPILATSVLCLRDRAALARSTGRGRDGGLAVEFASALVSAAAIGALFYGLGAGGAQLWSLFAA